jgi:hypothetical protein
MHKIGLWMFAHTLLGQVQAKKLCPNLTPMHILFTMSKTLNPRNKLPGKLWETKLGYRGDNHKANCIYY